MTREKAIELLKRHNLYSPTKQIEEAVEMAIEALKNEAERQELIIRASESHLGLVRCKDCKYCWYDDYTESLECRHNKGLNEEIYGNDFCCYGERREK